jgi:hypothetical protein
MRTIGYDEERDIQKALCILINNINDSLAAPDEQRIFEVRKLNDIKKNGTFVRNTSNLSYNRGAIFEIHISKVDIDDYAKSASVDTIIAAKTLASHEIFHVLLDHFNKKYVSLNRDLFNIAADLEVNSYINAKGFALRAEEYGLPDFMTAEEYYNKLYNQIENKVKQKLTIIINDNSSNTNNLQKDQSNSSNKPNQNEEQNDQQSSTTIIIDNTNNQEEDQDTNGNNDKNQEDNKDKNSNDLQSQDNSQTNQSQKSEKTNQEKNESDSSLSNKDKKELLNNEIEKAIQKLSDKLISEGKIINTNVSKGLNNQSFVDAVSNALSQINNIGHDKIVRAGTIADRQTKKDLDMSRVKGLDDLVRKLTREESAMSIQAHNRVQTYSKFNNRRKNGTIILPGKKLENDGIKKKYNKSLTVFIDISGSTSHIIKDLNSAAFKFHKAGATIVFYNTSVIQIIKPNESFRVMSSDGGTHIRYTIKRYIEDGNKLERAYIITDGFDNFYELEKRTSKFNVFLIQNNEINEIVSNKNPQLFNGIYGYRR